MGKERSLLEPAFADALEGLHTGEDAGAVRAASTPIGAAAVDADVEVIVMRDLPARLHQHGGGPLHHCRRLPELTGMTEQQGAQRVGDEEILHLHLRVGGERPHEEPVPGHIETVEAIEVATAAAAVEADKVGEQHGAAARVGRIEGEVGIAAGVVAHGVGDVATLAATDVAHAEHRAGRGRGNGVGGRYDGADELLRAVEQLARELARQDSVVIAGQRQRAGADDEAILRRPHREAPPLGLVRQVGEEPLTAPLHHLLLRRARCGLEAEEVPTTIRRGRGGRRDKHRQADHDQRHGETACGLPHAAKTAALFHSVCHAR